MAIARAIVLQPVGEGSSVWTLALLTGILRWSFGDLVLPIHEYFGCWKENAMVVTRKAALFKDRPTAVLATLMHFCRKEKTYS